MFLVAIIDLYTRKILAWRLSNTIDSEFCISALKEAIEQYGIPAIFNTDQGCDLYTSRFSSDAFITVLKDHDIEISMDGVNRALDNIYIERFWRTIKYEDIYMNGYETMSELKESIKRYMKFYNTERFYQSLDYATPDEMYYATFTNREGLVEKLTV